MMQPTATATKTEFDRTTSLSPVEGHPGAFTVELDPLWSSLAGIHGGYLCAVAIRGAESLVTDRTVRTVTTSFLRPGQAGSATLIVREVRTGRTMSTLIADLTQDNRPVITARMTLLTERTGVEWNQPRPVDLPPVDQCVELTFDGPVSHFRRADSRWSPDHRTAFGGDDVARVNGYVRPLERRAIDAAWLAMATDWFPPPAFARLQPPIGGVSIDLTTHIHRSNLVLGDDEWLAGEFEIENSTGGLALERGRIVQADGTLVAESIQTRLTTQG